LLHHRFPSRNDFGRVLQFWCIEWQAQNFAARRVCARKQIERIVSAEAGELYLVAELRDLLPAFIWPEQIMREIPAVAVRYSRENVFAVAGCGEGDLRYSWKVFADRILVLCVGGAELMKVNLLIKIEISIWQLVFPGKPCVKHPGAIRVPSRTAACRGILDMRNRVWERFARRSFVKVKCSIFASAFVK